MTSNVCHLKSRIRTLAALINSSARHSAIVLTDLNAESRAPKNNY